VVTHVVLLTPRADLTGNERDEFVRAFDRAIHGVPGVRGIRLGRRVLHGAGYETAAPPLEFLALIDFDDLAALQTYLRHPAHAQLGELFGSAIASALVFDYEVGGLEILRELAGGGTPHDGG
jgi:hypothetical protein